MRIEHAVLDVASTSRHESEAVAAICDAVRCRRTTLSRLLSALEARPRLRHRALLRTILADVADGTHSVLEREYLTRVERPHGLPRGSRQRRVQAGRSAAYRDVEYLRQHTIIELDGRLGHELALDRWDDLARDVDSLISGALTVRLGWAQVLQPCRAASAVAGILIERGWREAPRRCSETCLVAGISGAQPAPGARRASQIG